MVINVVSFSFSWTAQPEARRPSSLLDANILSPTGLVSKLVSKLTDFLSSPSYIIVQSPTQSFEWHVWSSSSGNKCHPVHRSLSSGASVMTVPWDFTVSHIVSLARYAISSHNCHWNVSLPLFLEWHVWPGRRSIYNTSKSSEPQPERRRFSWLFRWWQKTSNFYKTIKTNSDFCLFPYKRERCETFVV